MATNINRPSGLTSLLSNRRLFGSAVRRSGLPRIDLVFEAVRIEAVEPTIGRFSLRIYEEADWLTGRCCSATSCAKLNAIQFISQDPNSRARAFFTISSSSDRFPGGSFQHNLPHVSGIYGNPAVTAGVHFGSAVLCFRDVFRRGPRLSYSSSDLAMRMPYTSRAGRPAARARPT